MSQTINDLRDRYLKAIPGGHLQPLEAIRKRYIEIHEQAHWANSDECFDYDVADMDIEMLMGLAEVYRDLAIWKLSYVQETPGVTRVTPVVAMDSAA